MHADHLHAFVGGHQNAICVIYLVKGATGRINYFHTNTFLRALSLLKIPACHILMGRLYVNCDSLYVREGFLYARASPYGVKQGIVRLKLTVQIIKAQYRQRTRATRLQVAQISDLKPAVGLVFFVEDLNAVAQVFQPYTFVGGIMLQFQLF